MNPPRIVSLMPAATEWLVLFGSADLLVGGTRQCALITGQVDLPVVLDGPPTPPLALTAAEPRLRVASRDIDLALLADLAPDLVIGNAWDERWSDTEGQPALVSGMSELWWWEARTMRDVLELALRTGRRTSRFERTMQVMGEREKELRVWRDRIGLHRRAPDRSLLRTVIVAGIEPPVLAGGWTAELVDRAALLQVGPSSGSPAEVVSWEDIRRLKPALIVLAIAPENWQAASRQVAELGLGAESRVVLYDPAGRLDTAGPGLHEAILDLSAVAHELDGRDLTGRTRLL